MNLTPCSSVIIARDIRVEFHARDKLLTKKYPTLHQTTFLLYKYILLTEFEVRTVRYGPSFFPIDSEMRPAKLTNHTARTN